MKLGVSAWRLAGQRLGIGRYIEYMLRYWAPLLRSDEVTVFVREAADLSGFGVRSCLIRPALTNALWENLLLPWRTKNLDVLFGPSYTIPILPAPFGPRCRRVVAIHSVDEQRGVAPWWHRYTYEQKYRWSCDAADRVIANSHYVKQRLIDLYGVPPEKIDVIWLGADDVFHPVDDPELLRQTRIKYLGSDRPFVLFMGGLSQRRNVPMLIEAFAALKKHDGIPHALLLMGPNRANIPVADIAKRFGVSGSVVQTIGKVANHRELVPVYCAADAYVLPSSSEGFSLTMAEAMACGTPVITVNRAALGEVAHGFGLTIEAPELDQLTDALRRVVGDAALHAELRRKGLERAKELCWPVAAHRTLEVLRQVANS